jgi:hypothetical protein
MKRLAAWLLLVPAITFAGEIKLGPYFPSPFPNEPFSLAASCFVNGFNTNTGNFYGTCRYTGSPNSAVAWAQVEWSTTDGTPLYATACFLYANQGSPVCPARKYVGTLQQTDRLYVFMQGHDALGDDAVEVNYSGVYQAAILTP